MIIFLAVDQTLQSKDKVFTHAIYTKTKGKITFHFHEAIAMNRVSWFLLSIVFLVTL